MLLASALLIALFSINSQAFTPISTSRQWKKNIYRSTTELFDTELFDSQAVPEIELWNTKAASPAALLARKTLDERANMKNIKRPIRPSLVEEKDKAGVENEYPPKRKIRASIKETGYDSMRTYIKTMCNHELLNKNEEIILAREIQILLKWELERESLEAKLLR
jgi:hypothetical protein